MPNVLELHDLVAARLRGAGQRYTPKRRALVETLERAGQPVSIVDLLSGRPGLPQSSAYRNLAVLEQAGVVRRVVTDEEYGRYELTEDLTEHHHHLICSNCGKVEDVTIPATFEQSMDRTLDRLARRTGFAQVSHRLDLIGTCRDCA
ncbi:MAG TPA: Fur family transcriptional regulator [Actinomycetota bacterium]|jgi:Fe2+ or Zn2+ uptake regulation protein